MEAMIASVIAALITGSCSVIGVVLSSNKSTAVIQERLDRYREHTDDKLDELSKRVEKHNGVIERTFKLESDVATMWHRHDEMKEDINNIRERI